MNTVQRWSCGVEIASQTRVYWRLKTAVLGSALSGGMKYSRQRNARTHAKGKHACPRAIQSPRLPRLPRLCAPCPRLARAFAVFHLRSRSSTTAPARRPKDWQGSTRFESRFLAGRHDVLEVTYHHLVVSLLAPINRFRGVGVCAISDTVVVDGGEAQRTVPWQNPRLLEIVA